MRQKPARATKKSQVLSHGRFVTAALLLALVAGCMSVPPRIWYRDGVRVDANPQLLAAFQRDRVVCDGEAAEAALKSQERDLMIHNRNVNLVFDACLTKLGYTGLAE